VDLVKLRKFETLGPFEIKMNSSKLARKTSRTTQSAFLNAGRGNPTGSPPLPAKDSSCSASLLSPKASG